MKARKTISLAFASSMLVVVALTPVSADQWHHGNIREFHSHDFHAWRGGYWHNGYYGERLGWWWIVGGVWYYYPRPIYPYPDPYTPPVVIVQPSPTVVQVPAPSTPQPQPPVAQAPTPSAPPVAQTSPQYWYYCESAKAYYPYVPSCQEEWKKVPATPTPASGTPPNLN